MPPLKRGLTRQAIESRRAQHAHDCRSEKTPNTIATISEIIAITMAVAALLFAASAARAAFEPSHRQGGFCPQIDHGHYPRPDFPRTELFKLSVECIVVRGRFHRHPDDIRS